LRVQGRRKNIKTESGLEPSREEMENGKEERLGEKVEEVVVVVVLGRGTDYKFKYRENHTIGFK